MVARESRNVEELRGEELFKPNLAKEFLLLRLNNAALGLVFFLA